MDTPYLPEPPSRYEAYLVRLWRESPAASWRASAKHVLTGEQRQFASLEHLFIFLHAQTMEDG